MLDNASTTVSPLREWAFHEVEHDDDMPRRLLVFDEQHGTRFFYAGTPEATYAAALTVLNDRFSGDHAWFKVGEELAAHMERKPVHPHPEGFDVKALPESLRKEAERQVDRFKEALRDWQAEHTTLARLKAAVDCQDGKEAYFALFLRRHGEDEGMRFRYLSNDPTEVLAVKAGQPNPPQKKD